MIVWTEIDNIGKINKIKLFPQEADYNRLMNTNNRKINMNWIEKILNAVVLNLPIKTNRINKIKKTGYKLYKKVQNLLSHNFLIVHQISLKLESIHY